MRISTTSTLLGAVVFALVLGIGVHQTRSQPKQGKPSASKSDGHSKPASNEKPFTPEIEKFVETFTPAGEGIDGAGDMQPRPPKSRCDTLPSLMA